ncbi:MAG: ORF6N domain-containing protein [Pyrinomonadaceae bacterium]
MRSPKANPPAVVEPVEPVIQIIRGQKVILDRDLAQIYGVEIRTLNQAVRRNIDRFPADFMFQLSAHEYKSLRSQTVISKRGGRRYLPFAFTEHGAVMAATVLNSKRAVAMSLYVVRAFVKLRETLAETKELAHKLDELERKLTGRLDVHEKAILKLFAQIKDLLKPPPPQPRKRIGF